MLRADNMLKQKCIAFNRKRIKEIEKEIEGRDIEYPAQYSIMFQGSIMDVCEEHFEDEKKVARGMGFELLHMTISGKERAECAICVKKETEAAL